ncbi:hypothetical protein P2318_31675 [Myxococcaceae bacterium GXIMD 01537]
MAYTHVQFIAYQIRTVPAQGLFGNGKQYLGLQDDKLDSKARCAIMKDAFFQAEQHNDVSKDGSCLKIFMAPEFYFRGESGAYSMDVVTETVETLRDQVHLLSKWKDWLFVFGTILGYSAVWDLTNNKEDTAKKREVYNVAFVQKGKAGEDKGCVVVKEHLSTMGSPDFISRSDYSGFSTNETVLDRVEYISEGKASGSGNEKQKRNYDGRSIFEIDGITFGLEVCLDHLVGRLRKSAPSILQNRVQVQLVPSGGMTINDKAVIANTGGYAFNCDGVGLGRSEAKKVTTRFTTGSNATLSTINKTSEFTLAKTVHSDVPSYDQLFEAQGKIVIYPKQLLPASSWRGLLSDT